LSYSGFQTSQTGGQQYSDTSPFSIPCHRNSQPISLTNTAAKNIVEAHLSGVYTSDYEVQYCRSAATVI
jgi:hypothetical protein